MQLVYANLTPEILDVKDRFKKMSLAYQEVIEANVSEPMIIDGKIKHIGLAEMQKFLDQLDSETHQWWYCNC